MPRLRDVASGVVVSVSDARASDMLGRRWELLDDSAPAVEPVEPQPKVKPGKTPTK